MTEQTPLRKAIGRWTKFVEKKGILDEEQEELWQITMDIVRESNTYRK